MNDALSEVFNIKPVEVITPNGTSVTVVADGDEDDDHLYARARHYELAEKGSEALALAMKIANGSENPRAIEVLSGLIKTLSDVNTSLLKLNKDKADIKTARTGKGNTPAVGTNVQNQQNIFVGSSKDLNRMLASEQNIINTNTDIKGQSQ